ncbi:protein fem-1 homolog A-like [Brevipalpus obovatus]|uniref:protein fem-1 homolog A-like n=1 Tax=Brevipalpus obovatus TaxID=246614 RepID=UPI003D9EF5E6
MIVLQKTFSSLIRNFNHPYTIWMAHMDSDHQRDVIFDDLYNQCFETESDDFMPELVKKMETISLKERREIVSRTRDGFAPLFSACLRGSIRKIEYLVDICGADIEQRGVYECDEDKSFHFVTPLWCAAVSGKLDVLKFLVERGADIDSVSDKGSTPVRSACYMNHVAVVSYLIDLGADISRPNYSGGTCLINAIQSLKLCQLLLENGADVNAKDYQGKTALHYAIGERNIHTVALLLEYGADAYARTVSGDDPLQIACMKLDEEIFKYLIRSRQFPPERLADAYELMGAVYLDDNSDYQRAIEYWKEGLKIRNIDPLNRIPKNKVSPKAIYQFRTEFETFQELDRLIADTDAMKIQSLLIFERILGVKHRDMIFKLLIRGATYVDSQQFQKCIDIWRYALELRIARDTLLSADTSLNIEAIVKLFIDFHSKSRPECRNQPLRFEDVFQTTELLIMHFSESISLLQLRPVFKRHQESFDSCLKGLTHLMYVLDVIDKDPHQKRSMYQLVDRIVGLDPRDSNNNTLLHLSVMRNNKMVGYPTNLSAPIFPNLGVARLLLECGADVDAVNNEFCTPLHLATEKFYKTSSTHLYDLLLANGAHLDRVSGHGLRPINQLKSFDSTFNPINHISLKCLAARTVVAEKINYHGLVPPELENFLKIH